MKMIKILFLILFLNLSVLANVKLNAPKTFTKGEPLIFSFEAVGEDIKFPDIKEIAGNPVESLESSRSIQIINSNYSEKITKRYRFYPKADVVIPSFTFEISGQEFKSQEVEVKSKELEKTKSQYFDLSIKALKNEIYVGDSFVLKLIFKYKKGLQITDLGFAKPHFDGFWSQRLENSSKQYEENDFFVQELDFLLFPQKSGVLEISSLRVDVQMLDPNAISNSFSIFQDARKYVKVYSNSIKLDVKSLPQGVSLIGDFDLKASINKDEINSGESISYKLEVLGHGNFLDIGDLKIPLENVTIYENKPEIKTRYVNNKNAGLYTKTFSIVPEKSMTIPSIELKYFNIDTKKVEIKRTQSFNIKVNEIKKQEVVLQKQSPNTVEIKEKIVVKELSLEEKLLYFFYGVVFSLVLVLLTWYIKNSKAQKKEDKPLVKQVKLAKNKKELLSIILPFIKKDKSLDSIIFRIENTEDIKLVKKELIEVLKELNI